ncbi:hypothetical protein MT1096.2 [Mycobacterium tuberculosis CDC1551]|uniref:Uncharacterized protein n=1 Tax=Mycobacterium tuberculosis (strain CDC 1551 / Oshkosh) TaxID=83331 RepID=Q8VK80_MYCTO|nr:hypothetical protein MT1096.2 [Mycobacterium tuberculosis CDC1551]
MNSLSGIARAIRLRFRGEIWVGGDAPCFDDQFGDLKCQMC